MGIHRDLIHALEDTSRKSTTSRPLISHAALLLIDALGVDVMAMVTAGMSAGDAGTKVRRGGRRDTATWCGAHAGGCKRPDHADGAGKTAVSAAQAAAAAETTVDVLRCRGSILVSTCRNLLRNEGAGSLRPKAGAEGSRPAIGGSIGT